MSGPQAPSPRTRIRRLPERGHYDFDTVAAIVDEALTCTVAFTNGGSIHAIPTIHWREGEHLYIHGAKGSRMLKALTECEACVTISLVDGLVLARSAMHHSMNFRSVVVYGRFELVEDSRYKLESLKTFIEQVYPGRWAQLRPISDKELNATSLLRLSLTEASAKVRAAGVKDDEEDLDWPVWAGVLTFETRLGTPQLEADSVVREGVPATRFDRAD